MNQSVPNLPDLSTILAIVDVFDALVLSLVI